MNIHIIKVSLAGDHLKCTPHRCMIDADQKSTLIVWMLDETLAEANFHDVAKTNPNPGFEFVKKPPPKRFDAVDIDTPRTHLTIMNNHFTSSTKKEEWRYTLRVEDADGTPYQTLTSGRGRPPVIINR